MNTGFNNDKIYMNENMNGNYDEIDIIKLFKRLFTIKNIIIMLIAGIIVGCGAFAYSKLVLPELFVSDVSLYVNSSTVRKNNSDYYSNEGLSVVDMTSLATSRNLADSYVIILSNDAVMEEIGDELLKMYTPEQLSEYFPIDEKNGKQYIKGKYIAPRFEIAPVDETEILKVTVTTGDPMLSVNMCNAMVKVAPVFLPTIANGGAVQPIGTASVPDGKSYPNNGSNGVKGFMVGVFLVIFILTIIIIMDTKIRNTDSFKEKFDYPVLGEIPLINIDDKKKGVKKNGADIDSFQVNEAFNALCNNLLVTMSMNDEKVIIVSSPEMSDGKSTTAIKLARAAANMGNKVLLMDLDLRRPSIHKKLNAANKEGFMNLLTKPDDFQKLVKRNVEGGFDVLLSGGVSPNPTEMLSSKRTNDIFEKSKEIYDVIIVDSPPINVVTDACVVAQFSGGIVIVVRSNGTNFDDFRKAAGNVEITRNKIAGVIINGVEELGTKYGKGKYQYKSGYGYGYGYSYNTDEQKPKKHEGKRS